MSTQFFRNSLLKVILGKACNIRTYIGRSKTASLKLFSQLRCIYAGFAQNSGCGALEGPLHLLGNVVPEGLDDLPGEVSMDTAGLQPGNECGLALGTAAHPGGYPLLGVAAITQQPAVLERVEALMDHSLWKLALQQFPRQKKARVLAARKELHRLLVSQVQQMRVAQLGRRGIITGATGRELERLDEFCGDKKRGTVGERDMNSPTGGSSLID